MYNNAQLQIVCIGNDTNSATYAKTAQVNGTGENDWHSRIAARADEGHVVFDPERPVVVPATTDVLVPTRFPQHGDPIGMRVPQHILDEVAALEARVREYARPVYEDDPIVQQIRQTAFDTRKCPSCHDELVMRENGSFLGCTSYCAHKARAQGDRLPSDTPMCVTKAYDPHGFGVEPYADRTVMQAVNELVKDEQQMNARPCKTRPPTHLSPLDYGCTVSRALTGDADDPALTALWVAFREQANVVSNKAQRGALWDAWVKHVVKNVRTRPVTDNVVKRVVACMPRVVGADKKRKAGGSVVDKTTAHTYCTPPPPPPPSVWR